MTYFASRNKRRNVQVRWPGRTLVWKNVETVGLIHTFTTNPLQAFESTILARRVCTLGKCGVQVLGEALFEHQSTLHQFSANTTSVFESRVWIDRRSVNFVELSSAHTRIVYTIISSSRAYSIACCAKCFDGTVSSSVFSSCTKWKKLSDFRFHPLCNWLIFMRCVQKVCVWELMLTVQLWMRRQKRSRQSENTSVEREWRQISPGPHNTKTKQQTTHVCCILFHWLLWFEEQHPRRLTECNFFVCFFHAPSNFVSAIDESLNSWEHHRVHHGKMQMGHSEPQLHKYQRR